MSEDELGEDPYIAQCMKCKAKYSISLPFGCPNCNENKYSEKKEPEREFYD